MMRRLSATPIHKPLDAASIPSPHALAAARSTRKGHAALRLGEAAATLTPVVVGTALVAICLAAGPAVFPTAALADAEAPIVSETPAGGAGQPSDPGQTPIDPQPTPAPSPAPTLIASRTDVAALTPGQQAEIEVTFENTGDTAVVAPIASFSTSSGLVLVGNSSTVALPDIEPHGTQTVKVTVAALEGSAGAAQSLGVETRFNYMAGDTLTQASATDSVPIPCAAASGGDNGGGTPAEPGGTGNAGNPGDTGDGGDSGNAGGDTGDWGGGSTDWDGAGGDYDYTDSWGGSAQQTTTAGGPDKPVPNVIVNSFSYGDGTGAVAAGSEFPLTFAFTNTSTSLAVENLVVSVDTGDQFTINGGTNTFYSASLGANGVQQQTLNLKAISSEKAVPGTLTISFKYEYVENNERKSANTEVKLTVPVYQPDRFELSAPTPPEGAMVGNESTVTLSYVNKGKSAVSNVAVSVSGEGISTQTSQQNVGNIESGKSGTIGLAFTPTQGGTLDLTLTVEYENANDDVVTKTFPLTVDVLDDPYASMSDEELAAMFGDGADMAGESDEPQGLPVPAIVGIAVGAALLVALIVVAVRRQAKKRRKAVQDWDADDDWGGYGVAVPPLNQHVPVISRGQDTIVRDGSHAQGRVPGELGNTEAAGPHDDSGAAPHGAASASPGIGTDVAAPQGDSPVSHEAPASRRSKA